MKLAILHLSDMHFDASSCNYNSYVKKIVSAIQNVAEVSYVVIVLSGDIANKGNKDEYTITQNFLENLCGMIKIKYNRIIKCDIIIVPGNHDVMRLEENTEDNIKKSKECILKGSLDCIIKMRKCEQANYNQFAENYGCQFESDSAVTQKVLTLDKVKFNFTLINTCNAPYRDDAGYHFLTADDIEKIKRLEGNDFSFAIMHHPLDDFNVNTKQQLFDIFIKKYDFILYGHEHYARNTEVKMSTAKITILKGNQLCKNGNWDESGFYCGILNTSNRQFQNYIYKYDKNQDVYVEESQQSIILSRNRRDYSVGYPTDNYMLNLFRDNKFEIGKIDEYFVFPLLRQIVRDSNKTIGQDIESMDSFMERLEKNKKIFIYGNSVSGKTTLARQIFRRLIERRYTLFFDANDIHDGNLDYVLKETFYRIYGHDKALFDKFRQSDKCTKAIVIDGVMYNSKVQLERFLTSIKNDIDIIVVLSDDNLTFDVLELVRELQNNDRTIYRICPMFSNKRKELVYNLASISGFVCDDDRERKIEKICQVLKEQAKLIDLYPSLIIYFFHYFKNLPINDDPIEGDIFSKVFESNIVDMIKPYIQKSNVDTAIQIISLIAGYVHKHKLNLFSENDLLHIIDNYIKEYDVQVKCTEIIKLLVSSKLVRENSNGFYFARNEYLAYFAAKYIRQQYNETGIYDDIEEVIREAYIGINADILLFVVYLEDNVKAVEYILEIVEKYIQGWNIFDIKNSSIHSLMAPIQPVLVSSQDREAVQQEYLEIEQSTYDEEDKKANRYENELIKELLRATALLSVTSRILPNFDHIMKKELKSKCVKLVYEMPLKIFEHWVISADRNKEYFIEAINDIIDRRNQEYGLDNQKQKREKGRITAEGMLWLITTSLLLDLVNLAMSNGTRQNTKKYLDDFYEKNCSFNDMFAIEHLMSLDCRNDKVLFTSEVEKIYNKSSNFLKGLILRIVKHFCLYAPSLKEADIQKLISKVCDKTNIITMNQDIRVFRVKAGQKTNE